jgi:UDPglucose 6-dehydrogenase
MKIEEELRPSKRLRIGIIGNGVVGHATARCYMEQHEVKVWDIDPPKATHGFGDTVRLSDIVFVCLPETNLDEFFNALMGQKEIGQNYVIRSTCPIGTTKRIRHQYGVYNLVHSPEFLTERCAVTDAQLPSRNIIGKSHLLCDCGGILLQLYKSRFPSVQTLLMSSDESEAIKLFTNAFFATKITFFNEIYELSQKHGLDWNTVLAGMLSDGRISHSHTQVPGPDGKMGFGGKCLPKDLLTLISDMGDCLLRKVMMENDLRRKE